MKYRLPVRCTHDMKPLTSTAIDGGWSIVEFNSETDMRGFMTDYPRSFMPCWKRLDAEGAHLFTKP